MTYLFLGDIMRATAHTSAAGAGKPMNKGMPFLPLVVITVGMLAVLLTSCQTVSGSISGTVTNDLTGKPLVGATIITDPPIKGINIQTDSRGVYSARLPVGYYSLTFKKDNFKTTTQTVSVVAGQTGTRDVALKPTGPVAVNAGKDQTGSPGSTVTLKATAQPLDGSTVTAYQWRQVSGTPASIDNPKSDTIKVTLGNVAAYKAQLIQSLKPEDRFLVQGITPYALESAEIASFTVTVTTSSGSYSDAVNVSTSLPYVVSAGIADVPRGLPVLIHGKSQTSYNWSLTSPTGSKATLDLPSDQNPSFTPDVVGKYTISEKNSSAVLNIYAGTWAGAITGQDDKGRPLAGGCTICHNGTVAPGKFTAWKASGHAEIFTQNLNTNASYGEQCFACHSVGFNKTVNNGGFDDAADYQAFLNSGMLTKPGPNNWTDMLAKYPRAAMLANDQCETCHGPNEGTTLHPNGTIDAARVSIAAEVCGTCHGEPLRHGRFQQWQQSAHGDYRLAIDESGSASCARCHTGQGFLIWLSQGDLTKQIQGAKGNATADELKAMGITKATAQPQTCTVCHDPHAQGTTSGKPNTATVRIEGNTKLLPAGFQALNVGRGAICITCHNTRNGAHNDANPPPSYSAPHTPAQGDVLMGENAYFVARQRSPHSFIKDTCITCHMELTPPPPEFSYEGTGTNHSFKASLGVCSNCHSDRLDAAAFKESHQKHLQDLAGKMGDYLLAKMPAQITVKDYTAHTYSGKSYDVKSNIVILSKDNIGSAEPTEPHGQQGFLLKFKSPVTFTYAPAGETPHSMTLTEARVQLGDITTDGTKPLIALTDVLVRAGWNYFLIEADSSDAIHNPAWANEVLDASIEALFPAKGVARE